MIIALAPGPYPRSDLPWLQDPILFRLSHLPSISPHDSIWKLRWAFQTSTSKLDGLSDTSTLADSLVYAFPVSQSPLPTAHCPTAPLPHCPTDGEVGRYGLWAMGYGL